MEQPHVAIWQKRRAFFVPVLRTLSSLGAVTGLGVFWVAALKREPHAPIIDPFLDTLFMLFYWDTILESLADFIKPYTVHLKPYTAHRTFTSAIFVHGS